MSVDLLVTAQPDGEDWDRQENTKYFLCKDYAVNYSKWGDMPNNLQDFIDYFGKPKSVKQVLADKPEVISSIFRGERNVSDFWDWLVTVDSNLYLKITWD